MFLLTFTFYLVIALSMALLADRVIPGKLASGVFGATVCGIIGGWAGGSGLLLGAIGPSLFGVAVIPAILCCASVILVLALNGSGLGKMRTA